MLTVEAGFKREMETLWTTGVSCTVSAPDERWVSAAAGAKAAVIATDFEIRTSVGPGRTRTITDGQRQVRGKCQFVLEARIATENAAEELLTLCEEFVQYFHLGFVFGDFQVNGPLRGTRVRAQRGGPRVTEMVIQVPVMGPFEVSAEKYEIEQAEVEVEVEGETVETAIVQEEGD